ncbi:MAG: MFS transporter [Spirochaetaceae bacterium]|nr:MAG: MFS transporter [Spirochaetaceae bacterium]
MRESDIEPFDPRPVLLLVAALFFTFVPRMLLAPLLLRVEESLGLSRVESGALFFFISGGYSAAMLVSGFVAARLEHRGTISVALGIVGIGLWVLSAAPTAPVFRLGLVTLGAGAGLYAPSGIATLTDTVSARHWGKALGLHETAPILGFFAAPLLVELAVRLATWRVLLLLFGAVCLAFAPVYYRVARGGRFAGAAPKVRHVAAIVAQPTFWIVAMFFVLAVGLEVGVYSMLPTFLVTERGLSGTAANSLVSVSRLTALLLVFSSGLLADRFGARLLIGIVCTGAGVVTVLIGVASGAVLVVAVLLQPMLVAAFFPAGFIVLTGVTNTETRNLVVAMVIPLAYAFGGGVVPTGIGWLSARGRFDVGFVIVGLMMIGAVALLRLLPRSGDRK